MGDSEGETGSNNQADGNGNWYFGNENQTNGNGNWYITQESDLPANFLEDESNSFVSNLFGDNGNALGGNNPAFAGGGVPSFSGFDNSGFSEITDANSNQTEGNGNWYFGNGNSTNGNGDRYLLMDNEGNVFVVNDESASDSQYQFDFEFLTNTNGEESATTSLEQPLVDYSIYLESMVLKIFLVI